MQNHTDPFESCDRDRCPSPDGAKFAELLELISKETRAVRQDNPRLSNTDATLWAIEGVAEAWELDRATESRVLAFFGVQS